MQLGRGLILNNIMNLLHIYPNGNCTVQLFSDGTKVREYEGIPAPVYPESIDVKITQWCNAGCQFCHESSTVKGTHGDLDNLYAVLKDLPAGAELALGGGSPLHHPQFDEFVISLSNLGIICNVTVNEFHFEEQLPRLKALTGNGIIHGVGYSIREKPCTWKYPNLVTHVIVGVQSPDVIQEITRYNEKVLLLGYKTYGKGSAYLKHNPEVSGMIDLWYRKLFEVAANCKVSFDNLAIKQLNPRRLFSTQEGYDAMFMGDDGQFTMYIDAVEQLYAKGSTFPRDFKGYKNIKEMFADISC